MGYQDFTTSQIRADDVPSLPVQGSFNGQLAFVDSSDEVYVWDGSSWDLVGPATATGFAPDSADYLVKTANGSLSAERVVTDTATITWDWGTAGQAKANVPDDAITDAKIRESAALSVIGRSANSVGNPADISAANDAEVLRRSGTSLGFGTIATAGIADNAVANAKIRDSGALSVIGRSANSSGDPADISASAASDQVLRESGSVLGFGTVATAGIADNAVTPAKMNDGTAVSVLGRSANSSGDRADIAASANGQILCRTSDAITFSTLQLPLIDPNTLSPYLLYDADVDDATYNDGDAVGSMTDQSGNGRHATQSTATKKPTFKTNILNGRAVYRFDGGDCAQVTATIGLFTVAVVLRGQTGSGLIYEHSANASTGNGSAFYSAVNNSMTVARGGTRTTRNLAGNWSTVNHWRIAFHQFDTGNHNRHRAYCDGSWVICGDGNLTLDDPGTGTVTDTLNVGARNNAASLGFLGDIAFLAMWTTTPLTSAQVVGVYHWLCDRYNL